MARHPRDTSQLPLWEAALFETKVRLLLMIVVLFLNSCERTCSRNRCGLAAQAEKYQGDKTTNEDIVSSRSYSAHHVQSASVYRRQACREKILRRDNKPSRCPVVFSCIGKSLPGRRVCLGISSSSLHMSLLEPLTPEAASVNDVSARRSMKARSLAGLKKSFCSFS